MPFPMKIQPVDSYPLEEPTRLEHVKPVVKSRFKRLFELQFLRNSTAEKAGATEPPLHVVKEAPNGGSTEFEPSSVCLAKMVQNFIEEDNERQSGAVKCGHNCCNCFNGTCKDCSEDEFDSFFGESNLVFSAEACEILKGLVVCASVSERNLLADTAKIVEKNKICRRKDDNCRKIVTDALLALGYDASICKSRWDKSPSYPAGEYEYIDVITEGERLIIDIDFRSEFEVARSTKAYRSILQTLPYIFVGQADRLKKIISIVSEAAKQSLKKKGMHVPPWRKADYIKAKWLSPHPRAATSSESDAVTEEKNQPLRQSDSELEPSHRENNSVVDTTELGEGEGESLFVLSESSEKEEKLKMVKDRSPPPDTKPKNSQLGVRVLTGLAAAIGDEDDP